MKRIFSCIMIFLVFKPALIFGQDTIKIPNFNDRYCGYVKQLENGKTDIDYVDFRHSFLESKQFFKKRRIEYDSLVNKIYAVIKSKNYQEVMRLEKALLSIDYTSMFAHAYLQQTYNILGDTVNRNKYHKIEFGLLGSIISSGDGNTCETGWHVTQIEEEYFIINYVGAKLQVQQISHSGKNTCDKMDIKSDEGETKTLYFEANKVFEMERKMFEK